MQPSRPKFASGYGISSEAAGSIPWEAVEAELSAARNYWIATVTPEGQPHATPIWGVWQDGRLYFGVDDGSQKRRNLEASNHAVLHLESGDDVVILHCEVVAEDDRETASAVLSVYASKYDLPEAFAFDPVLVARPYQGFAWREADYPATASKYTL